MWDAWSLGERHYPTKAAFIEAALAEIDAASCDVGNADKLVRDWIGYWEKE